MSNGPIPPHRRWTLLAGTTLGLVLLTRPVFAIDVASEAELRSAIETARTTPNTEIVLTADITLTQDLPALQGTHTIIRSSVGNAFAIDGSGQFRGLFVYSGSVTVQDLTIANAAALGGKGGDGGYGGAGGGAGLGGALFVNANATVSVSNVNLSNNRANGGAGGGAGTSGGQGGGGGMGGNGGNNPSGAVGGAGGGGIGVGANGGDSPANTSGASGIVTGAPGGGAGDAGPGGNNGGGGGGNDGGGGGVGGAPNSGTGAGGFGGGAGGFADRPDGGFGGGGAGNFDRPGVGGFGGGGGFGRAPNGFGGAGGFGGGNGGSAGGFTGGGGGGAGMGGAIFVVEGGTLNLTGNLTINGNTVAGGLGGVAGATAGSAFGSGLFLQGNGTLAFTPGAGVIQTISDVIADQTGSGGSGSYASGGPTCTPGTGCAGYSGEGVWGLNKTGAGTLVLNGNNTFTGGVTINGGTISAGHNNALGTGILTVLGSTLDIQNNVTISNAIDLQADLNINVGPGQIGRHAGDITSTGNFGINKIGGGMLFLSGSNAYTGTTNVNAGTLLASAVDTFSANSAHVVALGATLNLNNRNQTIGSLAGAGNVALSSATLTAGGDNTSTTFSGSMIDGPGVLGLAFIKEGTGTQTFSGSNTYSGATNVNAGILRAGAANTFSANSLHSISTGTTLDLSGFNQTIGALAGNGNVTLGEGTLTVAGLSGLSSTTFGGVMSGSGGFTKEGAFTQAFSDANTYFGATSVNAGTLEAIAVNAFSANSAHVVALGATLDLNNRNQTIGSLAGAGNVALGSATLTAGGDNTWTTFSGAMSGAGGFTKEGAGMQTFSGAQAYFGATTVNAGSLVVNGSLTNSDTTVNANGVLAGAGQVGNVTVNGGGFVPGFFAPGTQMTVNGNLTFNGGSTYGVNVDPVAVSSAVVTGTASLTGASVFATFHAGAYATNQYRILQAASLAGTFNALHTNQLPTGFDAALSYIGNDVFLRLTAQLGAGGHLTVNQRNVATSLNNYFNNGGTLPPRFASLFGSTGDALRNTLDQASGEAGASISQSTFLAWNQFFNMMFDPFAGGRSGLNGQGALPFAAVAHRADETRLAYAAVTPKGMPDMVTKAPLAPHAYEPHWSVWGGGYGGSATSDGNATTGSHDTTSRAYGFVVGADHRLTPDTLIGFALAGGGTSFGLAQGLGGGKSDLFQASVYARQNWGAAYLMGALGYGWQDFTLNRTLTIAGNDRLEANFSANTFAGRAEGGWRFGSIFTGMTPYAAVQVASIRLPSFSESATSGNNAFALSYSGRTDTQTRSELGARFDHAMPMENGVLTLRGRTAWAHHYGGYNVANAAFITLLGAAFTVNGARPDADALLVSAGAELSLRNGFSLAGSFEAEFSGNTESYAGKGAVRYRW